MKAYKCNRCGTYFVEQRSMQDEPLGKDLRGRKILHIPMWDADLCSQCTLNFAYWLQKDESEDEQ